MRANDGVTMPPKFIGQKINVTTDGAIKEPQSFTWENRDYEVAEILLAWMDWGFPQGSTQRDWRSRRHRNYYRVRTDSGQIFEIYHDRGPTGGGGAWYLFQQLT